MATLEIRSAADTKWDCASFGEVMLRFDPGFGRVRNARSFQVWEGGGEYNVARAMRKCWQKRAAVVTALPKNDLGWLVEDLILQGGVEATESSLRAWFGAGIVACGIGGNLVTKQLLDALDYKGIEEKVRTTVQLVKTIKADLAAKR